MGRVDPVVKSSVLAALRRVCSDGRPTYTDTMELAQTYGLAEATVRAWARDIERGEDPRHDARARRRGEDLPKEVLPLLVRHGTRKQAWKAASEAGLFRGGYRSFVYACNRLDPALLAGLLRGRDEMLSRLPVMSYPPVARNEIWVIDHTLSDIRVLPDRGTRAYRPWVTIIRDKGTRMVMAVRYTKTRVNAAHVLATMAAAIMGATPHRRDDGFIGGLPQSVLCDNGSENTADNLVEGFARLGTAVLPTTPGHSWQNGSAENIIKVFQRQFEHAQPGYARSGKSVDGGMRAVANTYDDQDPDVLLSLDQLQAAATTWATEYNNSPGSDGSTPAELWLADDAEVETRQLDELRWAMLVGHGQYAVTKNGMFFGRRAYQGDAIAGLEGKGKILTVRTLPGVTEWIEVWRDSEYLGRVYEKSRLPVAEQNAIIGRRRAVATEVRKAERTSQLQRDEGAINAAEATETGEADPLSVGEAQPARRRSARRRRGEEKGTERRAAAAADSAAERFAPLPLMREDNQ